VEQQSLVMHFAPQNIHELMVSVSERFAPTFEQNGKRFTVDYPNEHFTAIVDKEAVIKIKDREIRVCVAHTLRNARRIMEQVKKGTSPYDFIEIMACPGGCIGGGGQPIGTTNAIRKKRMAALYEIDRGLPLRKSHENPEIQTLYRDFLGEPLSPRAHELLHTTYHKAAKPYEFDE
jgi:NADH-quinone oxidoreductase subunit G/NADP-reducing hydrogenase subunit HndD